MGLINNPAFVAMSLLLIDTAPSEKNS